MQMRVDAVTATLTPVQTLAKVPSASQTTGFERQLKENQQNNNGDKDKQAGPDDKAPALTDYKQIDKPNNGVIRYQTQDGTWVSVSQSVNQNLFDQVVHDGKILDAIHKSEDEGYVLAGKDDKPPAFGDYKFIGPENEGADGIIRYETFDGKKVVVAEAINPALYDSVAKSYKALTAINKSQADGYSLPGPDDNNLSIAQTGSPDEFGNGVIRFSTTDGRKFVVSQELNPSLYQQALTAYENQSAANIDEFRKKHNLPPIGDFDVLSMLTDVPSDDNDKNSPKLSISDLAMKQLLESYKKGVEDGSIAKDDPRAQLLRLMQAKSAYQNGYDIYAYVESPGIFGGTWRESNEDPTHLTPADMHDIIDGDKLDQKLNALFNNDTIKKDYDAALQSALTHVPNRGDVSTKLENLLTSTEYVSYLQDLKNNGHSYEASSDVNRMLTALAALNPNDQDKVKKISQQLMLNGITADLNAIEANPDVISNENIELAFKDALSLIKATLKNFGEDVPRTLVGTIDNFINGVLSGKTHYTPAQQRQIFNLLRNLPGEGMSDADIRTHLNNVSYLSLADREGLAGFLGSLNKIGMLGSCGGLVSLGAGIYQLAGKGGRLADTPLERFAIAKDFLSFVSMSNHFVKLGDAIMTQMGKPGLVDMLGISKSLPDIWGKNGTYGKNIPAPSVSPELNLPGIELTDFSERWATAADQILGGASADDALREWNIADNSIYDGIADLFKEEAINAGVPQDKASSPAWKDFAKKIAGSTIGVLVAGADFVGGIGDIVLGAYTIKGGIDSNDPLQKAQGSLGILAGVTGAIAGGIEIAGLITTVSSAITAAVSPLFLATVVLAGIGAIIGFFVDHNKMQAATDKQGQWFKDLAGDGVLQDDWGDKVEYARYEIYTYGGRDAPEDQSIYDFQSKEWNHFRETPGEDGSSINRLDNELHIDYNHDNKGMPGYTDEDIPYFIST